MKQKESKPLCEETDIDTLRSAIDEYRWLAKVLYKTLGCGCGPNHTCWNCKQAESQYRHITEVYK